MRELKSYIVSQTDNEIVYRSSLKSDSPLFEVKIFRSYIHNIKDPAVVIEKFYFMALGTLGLQNDRSNEQKLMMHSRESVLMGLTRCTSCTSSYQVMTKG